MCVLPSFAIANQMKLSANATCFYRIYKHGFLLANLAFPLMCNYLANTDIMCVYYSSKLLSNTIKSIFFILFTLIYVFHDDDDDDNHYRQIKFQKICFFFVVFVLWLQW